MVTQPLGFLVPTLLVGLVMVLVGSGLRVVRRAGVRRRAACSRSSALLWLNMVFAAQESLLGVIPTEGSVRRVVYVIGNGAATLNTYRRRSRSTRPTPGPC